MTSSTTATMQQFGAPPSPDGIRAGGTAAGLVLLYSPDYATLQPAYLFTAREVFIGRDPTCAVCVPERAVSRRHAVVSFKDDRWVLRDLGGSNGTIVDGRFVGEVELEPQQEVRVGDSIFKYVPAGAELYAPYRIDGQMLSGATRRARDPSAMVGGMQVDRLLAQLERVAQAQLSVVVQGESGTGKEVVASEIHSMSGRRGPFQAVNCAAIPGNLIESELFGYKRGAFSGADRDKPGIIAMAHTGTLLLDEIGDMPLEAQAKLLRVLQAKEVYPVGATSPQKVDIRIVCATNRDLRRLVNEGRFRGDLLARLNEYSIMLPPLRDRKEDMFLLVSALLERHGFQHMQPAFPFLLALYHYDWPYNVRELESCMKRAAALAETPLLEPRHLPDAIREVMVEYGKKRDATPHITPPLGPDAVTPKPSYPDLSAIRKSATPTEQELRDLLAQHKGNVAAVGRLLGKERMQIHRWMQRYGIVVEEYRS